jgi:hypothetical protein
MVATQVRPGPYFTDDEEPSFRRYNSRGQGYPLSHDRELPSGSYGGPRDLLSNHDSRGGKHAPEPDHNSRPRSRIPVAVSTRIFYRRSQTNTRSTVRSMSKTQDQMQWGFGQWYALYEL